MSRSRKNTGTGFMKMIEPFIPTYFLERSIWVLWRLEEVKGRKTKVPYSAHYAGRASSTKKDTWASYNEAAAVYSQRPDYYSGLGVVIPEDDPLVFIDLDHCIDPETGELSKLAGNIIDHMPGAFTELSQSGTGLHLFALIDSKEGLNAVKRPEIEIYFSGRFCACTFNVQRAVEPQDQTAEILTLWNKYKKDKPEHTPGRPASSLNLSDEEIIRKAKEAKNGLKFQLLWSGEWKRAGYPSQSEADLALCLMLAFWTERNKDRMQHLFEHSGLCRPKFTDREDYRTYTLTTACSLCSSTIADGRIDPSAYDNGLTMNDRRRREVNNQVETLLQRF